MTIVVVASKKAAMLSIIDTAMTLDHDNKGETSGFVRHVHEYFGPDTGRHRYLLRYVRTVYIVGCAFTPNKHSIFGYVDSFSDTSSQRVR